MKLPTQLPRSIRHHLSVVCIATCLWLSGCRTPADYRHQADDVAYRNVEAAQRQALTRNEPFTINPPAEALRRRLLLDQHLPVSDPASLDSADMHRIEQWPDDTYFEGRTVEPPVTPSASGYSVTLSLIAALQIGARNSRDYQRQKELVYEAAMDLDLEAHEFRTTWTGMLDTLLSSDLSSGDTVSGVEHADAVRLSKKFETGLEMTGLVAIDLVKLLTQDRSSTLGITADASLSIPLLRGSSRFVVTEPLTQAQRDVVYAIYTFERFKRTFAVRVASSYLGVLNKLDQVSNAEGNYRGVTLSTRRARRLAEEGRLPEIQVDQARQDELSARNRWISARQAYEQRLDDFKVLLGLPTDARITLDRGELDRLAQSERYARYLKASHELDKPGKAKIPPADAPIKLVAPSRADAGPMELDESRAIELALQHRLDLRTSVSRIIDAQRGVAVAADDLRADLTLLGTATTGESRSASSAGRPSAELRPERGRHEALLAMDLPLERTSERNAYRDRLIAVERAVRDLQALEDVTKLQVRDALRALHESRETLRIQAQSVTVARRRVDSTNMFFELGRAQIEIRDVLDAQEDLVSAKNALTAALVSYRVAELELQRDVGVLQVDETGLWREYQAEDQGDGNQ